jgi:DNA-binding NarL/FixJ family response regulator
MYGLTRFEEWSRQPTPRAVARTVPGLSPRENDVLAAVACGATNAVAAADLFLSERTVEQHLRSIFDKLGLGDHGGSNRRVRAAAVWWQHQEAGDPTTTATG